MMTLFSSIRAGKRTLLSFVGFALLMAMAVPAHAQNVFTFEDEAQNAGWLTEGGAGIDRGLGYARAGANNGWIRGSEGWNSLRHEFYVGGHVCYVLFWARRSASLPGFYVTFIGAQSGDTIAERYIDAEALGYFRPDSYALIAGVRAEGLTLPWEPLIVRFGFWGNGQDAWLQLDNIGVTCNNGT